MGDSGRQSRCWAVGGRSYPRQRAEELERIVGMAISEIFKKSSFLLVLYKVMIMLT